MCEIAQPGMCPAKSRWPRAPGMLGGPGSTSLPRPSAGLHRGGGKPTYIEIHVRTLFFFCIIYLYICRLRTGWAVAPRAGGGLGWRWWLLTNSRLTSPSLPPSLSPPPRSQRFGSRTAEPNGEREKGTSKPSFAKTALVPSLTASCSPTMTCTLATHTTTGQPRA